MPSKVFRLYDVLAVTHGLPCLGSDYRAILEYLSGEPIPAPSHGLRVRDECRTWLLEQHPERGDVPERPDFRDDEAAMDTWCDEQVLRVGTPTMTLSPLPLDRRCFPTHAEAIAMHAYPEDVDVVTPEAMQSAMRD